MASEFLDQEAGDPRLAHAVGLSLPEDHPAVNIGERLGDDQPASAKITSMPTERGRLAPTETAVGEHVNQRSVRGSHGGREPLDLLSCEARHLGADGPRELHAQAWVAAEQTTID